MVADEVRKLASQSESATKRIFNIIASIQSEITIANQTSIKGVNQVGDRRTLLLNMVEGFDEILLKSKSVEQQTNEVSASTQELLSVAQLVSETFDRLVRFTRESQKQIDKVLRSSEDQNHTMRSMVESLNSLTKKTKNLNDLIENVHKEKDQTNQ
ncbi:methyl-accepting chemotaxis protein, partial [Halobacillus sp. BBL2006]|uniref:methyl-accepting chemotaxis protein n=1 Tax=Halobacillus sp. BBL2006 TaxID=1543706 RepID=UPI000543468B